MKIHWLIPGDYRNIDDLYKSHIASIRMRAGLVGKYSSDFQIQFTAGDHVNSNADIIVVGKIGMDCQNGRDNLWFGYLLEASKKNKKIIIDYTDNHLARVSPMFYFYKKILPLSDNAIVPSSYMSLLLAQYFNNKIILIEDPVEIKFLSPKILSNQNYISLLWFGHNTNIPYLVQYLQNNSLCDISVKINVLTNSHGIDLLSTNIPTFHSSIDLNMYEWSISNMINAADNSDACLIPSDINDPRKSGVGSNRLITAFALGLPVTADILASYAPFSEYFHNIRNEPLSLFTKQLKLYSEKCKKAQSEIIINFSEEVIVKKWVSFFNNL